MMLAGRVFFPQAIASASVGHPGKAGPIGWPARQGGADERKAAAAARRRGRLPPWYFSRKPEL